MKTLRVLLVDDDESSRELAHTRLSLLGYQVTPCSNGKDAVAMVQAHSIPFDLLITDLRMPGMNGADLIALLRSSPATAELPILIVSADPDSDLSAGADHVIHKPYHLHQLVQAIADTFRRREGIQSA